MHDRKVPESVAADYLDMSADYIAYYQEVDAKIMEHNRERIANLRNWAQLLRKLREK